MARSPVALPPIPWRRALRRARGSLALRWALVAVAAALAAVQVHELGEAAAAARDAWGQGVDVVVAADDLAAGEVVRAGDVRVERRPAAVVPDGALTDPPIGRTLRAGVVAGEVLVEARVAPGGVDGTAALVPPGWRAVAVPTSGLGGVVPPLAVGDRVDVLAPDVVVESGIVVAVADEAVSVAVPAADAPAVAEALATVAVTLALRGAG